MDLYEVNNIANTIYNTAICILIVVMLCDNLLINEGIINYSSYKCVRLNVDE